MFYDATVRDTQIFLCLTFSSLALWNEHSKINNLYFLSVFKEINFVFKGVFVYCVCMCVWVCKHVWALVPVETEVDVDPWTKVWGISLHPL